MDDPVLAAAMLDRLAAEDVGYLPDVVQGAYSAGGLVGPTNDHQELDRRWHIVRSLIDRGLLTVLSDEDDCRGSPGDDARRLREVDSYTDLCKLLGSDARSSEVFELDRPYPVDISKEGAEWWQAIRVPCWEWYATLRNPDRQLASSFNCVVAGSPRCLEAAWRVLEICVDTRLTGALDDLVQPWRATRWRELPCGTRRVSEFVPGQRGVWTAQGRRYFALLRDAWLIEEPRSLLSTLAKSGEDASESES